LSGIPDNCIALQNADKNSLNIHIANYPLEVDVTKIINALMNQTCHNHKQSVNCLCFVKPIANPHFGLFVFTVDHFCFRFKMAPQFVQLQNHSTLTAISNNYIVVYTAGTSFSIIISTDLDADKLNANLLIIAMGVENRAVGMIEALSLSLKQFKTALTPLYLFFSWFCQIFV